MGVQVVHKCSQRNLFLENIELHSESYPSRDGLLTGDALAAWQSDALPLLEMNRLHQHRLTSDPNQGSLFKLHETLAQVHAHPQKLFKLLQDFPRAVVPRLVSEQIRDLERTNVAQQNRQMELEIDNADLKRKVTKQQAQINSQQLQIKSLQEQMSALLASYHGSDY
jgi:hypothetical protein